MEEVILSCYQLSDAVSPDRVVLERDELEVNRRRILERCRRASQAFDEAVQDCVGVLLRCNYL